MAIKLDLTKEYKNYYTAKTRPEVVEFGEISFLPLIYFILLFAAYESLFIRLNLGYEKGKKLKNYARRKIIKQCLFSLKKIKKASNMNIYNLMHIRNEKDVDDMVKAYKDQV